MDHDRFSNRSTIAAISSPEEPQVNPSPRLESLGQLSSGVAHDFNNLLAVILGYAGLIAQRPELDDEVRADVDRIQVAARRAVRLTRQVMILGRRETSQPEVVDLTAVLADVRSTLAGSIGADVHLEVDVAPVLPAVLIHRGQLEQVLLNLAENARDAMPEGGTLTIAASPVDGGVRLTATDTGRGMSAEDAERAFEPFFTTKPTGEGTGLGLAIVYGIVTDAGGSVHIDTRDGAGTSMTVHLPAA